jgi:hypothetical protein
MALNAAAMIEYRRLLQILDARGVLERLDLATVAAAARVKEQLDRMCVCADVALDAETVKILHMLTAQWRGFNRDLGLTLPPNRTLVRAIAKDPASASRWGKSLRVYEE